MKLYNTKSEMIYIFTIQENNRGDIFVIKVLINK